MPSRIRKLSKELINKISAGEVVVSPASVIKELVENSIDAGAARVTVEIEAGGKKLIRVTDNGCGIARDDLEAAFDNNSTSKIESVENLSSISTLGFRGEALFSISVVSRVGIKTKAQDESVGSSASILDGKVIEKNTVAFNTGTQIEVQDLFYNTPARKKHMKSDRGERIASVDMVSKLAVANPSVSFTLISDGKEMFITPGDSDIRNAVLTVMGSDYMSGMVEVDYEDKPVKVRGFTLSPNYLDRKNEESILMVNGRFVRSDVLSRAINELYREQFGLFTKKISYVLYVDVPYEFTDVNIHPSKTTISFRNETLITMLVIEGLRMAVKSEIALNSNPAGLKKQKEEKEEIFVQQSLIEQSEPEKPAPAEGIAAEAEESAPMNEEEISFLINDTLYDYEPERKTEEKKETHTETELKPRDFAFRKTEEKPVVRKNESVIADRSIFRRITEMNFVGCAFRAYAIFESGNTLYVVDTHASHERVLYDSYLKQFESEGVKRQILLTPIVMDLSRTRKEVLLSNLEVLEKMGFEIEDFSGASVIVREIPEMFSIESARRSIEDVTDELASTGMVINSGKRNEKLISTACHTAVRGKDEISREEAVKLLEMLSETDNPFTCPHSRPTVSRIEKKYFEKMFQRI